MSDNDIYCRSLIILMIFLVDGLPCLSLWVLCSQFPLAHILFLLVLGHPLELLAIRRALPLIFEKLDLFFLA